MGLQHEAWPCPAAERENSSPHSSPYTASTVYCEYPPKLKTGPRSPSLKRGLAGLSHTDTTHRCPPSIQDCT